MTQLTLAEIIKQLPQHDQVFLQDSEGYTLLTRIPVKDTNKFVVLATQFDANTLEYTGYFFRNRRFTR